MKLPIAKSANIVVQNLNDEVLLYNTSTDHAFCLNETSAKVFNACDGKQTFEDLKREYNFTDDLIYLALDELRKQNLLDETTANYQSPFRGMNRREVIKKVGLATMIALPVITGLVAPRAANAASSADPGEPACQQLNACRPRNTIFCPTGCTKTYTFISYASDDGSCTNPTSTDSIDCSTRQNQQSNNDYRRVS